MPEPAPVWLCDCGYWLARNGGPPPECRYCRVERASHKKPEHRFHGLVMHASMRPEPTAPDYRENAVSIE